MGFELLSFRIRFSKRSKKVEWAKNGKNGDWKGFSGQAAGNRRWRSAEKKHKKQPSSVLHCLQHNSTVTMNWGVCFSPFLPAQWCHLDGGGQGHLLNGPRPKWKEARRKEGLPLLQMTSAASLWQPIKEQNGAFCLLLWKRGQYDSYLIKCDL